ncbi:ATP-binding protein [Leptolyngbya sp. FACHB-16]|uniref:ATP-binding protein n=1 Tax=unclassified Leptolyngbya TaxID=2650499 RepID=UPI001681F93A|nr:ATP-binding protein [Leptolyngbya sp. FACHB-16]MBD2157268.1 Cache 3/Cache 2 fusion domain-containing protein [Leptolyngbya sp. FACHB-16]
MSGTSLYINSRVELLTMLLVLKKKLSLVQSGIRLQTRYSWRNSIGTKLFIYVLGTSLLALGGTAFFFYTNLEARIRGEIQSKLNTKAESIEGQLQTARAIAQDLSAASQTLDESNITDPNVYKQLVLNTFKKRSIPLMMGLGIGQAEFELVPNRKWFLPYFFLDQSVPDQFGQPLPAPNQHIRYADLIDDRYFEQPYYTEVIAAKRPIWVEPYHWYGITLTTCAAPIFNRSNDVIGMVGVDVSVTTLGKEVNTSVITEGGYFAILSAQGRLLAYPPNQQQAKSLATFEDIPSLKQVWSQINQGQSGLVEVDGQYWAYQRIEATNWIVLAVVPKSAALRHVLLYTIVGAVGIGMILLCVVALFVKQLNQRLNPILKQCNDLKVGRTQRYLQENQDLSLAATPSEDEADYQSGDEIDVLAETIDEMTQQLQAAFQSLEEVNAELENRVEVRTTELKQALHNLSRTQAQIVQSEKMSALGQMVAGVAHEINNPVNFIHGNLIHVQEYAHNLLNVLNLYQKYYPKPADEIQAEVDEIDLEFVQKDLPKMLDSMKLGTDRIRQIVLSLRNFSRIDEAEFKDVNIHEGIDSTLLILQHRLKGNSERPAVRVQKDYDDLPLVECYPGQLNQVFMNILANALDAMEERNAKRTYQQIEADPSQITIRTSMVNAQWVQISIADNGLGMPEAIQKHIFNPFFTTKPIGKGTGMGMSISYQIITEKHSGKFECFSTPGEGTEFLIQIPFAQQYQTAK